MRLIWQIRFTLATLLMLVATAGSCLALFAKAREHVPRFLEPHLLFDAPFLLVLAIALTSIAFGALKGHTSVQVMLQMSIACMGYLCLIGLAESGMERPLLYWFQTSFALLVTLPLLARRSVKSRMARGQRRDWWKRTCEAILFSFSTMMLVLVWGVIQFFAFQFARSIFMPTPPFVPALPAEATPVPSPLLVPLAVPSSTSDSP